jgi:hypothetical protein
MKRKADPIDKQIEAEWYRQANGVQVSVLDIPAFNAKRKGKRK